MNPKVIFKESQSHKCKTFILQKEKLEYLRHFCLDNFGIKCTVVNRDVTIEMESQCTLNYINSPFKVNVMKFCYFLAQLEGHIKVRAQDYPQILRLDNIYVAQIYNQVVINKKFQLVI